MLFIQQYKKDVIAIKLNNVATVRSGLVLSRKESKEATRYRYELVTLKSFDEERGLIRDYFDVFYTAEPLNREYLTHEGDILIRMSKPYTAVLIDGTTSGLVYSANFTIIKCHTDSILPEYLCWLLNSDDVMKEIQKNNGKNMLGAIRSQFYAELEISDVPLDKQKQLGMIYVLGKRETELLRRLSVEKKKLYEAYIDIAQRKIRKENKI